MLRLSHLLAAAAFALLPVSPALAHDHQAMAAEVALGDLRIAGAFARATLPNAPVGAAYLTITNGGAADDRLVKALSPVAGVVQLHEMKMVGDVMQMSELPDGIAVPVGQMVTLQPGGLHIMLMELKQPLVEGTMFPVTLTFEKAGTIEVQVMVGGFAADQPVAMDHAAHGNGMGTASGDMSDVDAIAQMQKAMFDKPDSPLDMGPIIVSGEYAVSDWAQGGMGGRALLRKTDKGWAIHLCAGDGLKDAANLSTIGVPLDIATQLADGLAKAEAGLDAEHLRLYGSFDGTMMVDASLIRPGIMTPLTLSRLRLVLWGLLLVVALAATGVFVLMPQAVTIGGGTYALVDQGGNAVDQTIFRGHPSLLFFGYTHCPDVCPTTMAEMSQWFATLGPEAGNLGAYFVTVDPERDTPALLGEYVSWVSDRITGLTGSRSEIDKIVAAWHVLAEKVPSSDGGYTMNHTASVFLLDASGRLVGTIAYQEATGTALDKIRRLLGKA